MPRILHVLAQRPGRTGSGVTLDALVRETERIGAWEQHVVCGVPVGDAPEVGGLGVDRIHALRFGEGGDLPFPVPGMSDVMPYESTVWSSMPSAQVDAYVEAWRQHLLAVTARVLPDLIHVHHIWLLASLLKDVAPGVPVVGHCHATGLRQMELTPHLAERVREGNRRHERFAVLHREHQERLSAALSVPVERISVVGAGFREEAFPGPAPCQRVSGRVVYVGKLSGSKGVDALLDAVETVASEGREVELHMAGGGSGAEADALRARYRSMGSTVHHHGFVDEAELSALMCSAEVFILPSYYEGLPLVLVEAAAAGARLISTALPGVVEVLAPVLGDRLELVPIPEMASVDVPTPRGAVAHAAALAAALRKCLGTARPAPVDVSPFRWSAVSERVHRLWDEALGHS